MINNKKISLIIPCKNEENVIGKTIRNIPKYIDEIIVVDNNSSDRTAEVAQQEGAIVIKEIRQTNGIGYGYAHQTGIQRATGHYIAALDGDGTYPAFELEDIVNKMEAENIDFISCNRLPLAIPYAISKTRELGVRILNMEVKVLYGKPMKDILSGMWCFKSSIKDKLNLKEGGWDLSPEIKLNALLNPEIKFQEYHIVHFVRNKEPSKQQIWKTGYDHARYIFTRRFK